MSNWEIVLKVIFVTCLIGSLSAPTFSGSVGAVGTPKEVSAPDYDREGFEEQVYIQIDMREDGSATVTYQVNYIPEGDASKFEKSDYPLQTDEEYSTFEASVHDRMESLVSTSAEKTGRKMSLLKKGTQHTYAENRAMMYRWKYRWEGIAATDGDRLVLTEPLSSAHPIFTDENTGLFLHAYPYAETGVEEYYFTEITEKHKEYFAPHDPPWVLNMRSYDNEYSGFRAVFAPQSDLTTTTTATSTNTPTMEPTPSPTAKNTDTTAPRTTTSPTTSGFSPLVLAGLGAVAVLLLGIIGVRQIRRDEE